MQRLALGHVWIDAVTTAEALDRVEALVAGGQGGAVFTPNLDHIVNAESNLSLRGAYARADLSLADGQPVVWASRLLACPLPEKISGADFVWPLARRAADRGWGVYLLGGAPGIAERAADVLRQATQLRVVGTDSPDVDAVGACDPAVIARVRSAAPELVWVALGSPKQELFIDKLREQLRQPVWLGIGASLDFIAGAVARAPRWMSRSGLEWLYRLSQEPRRLWRRYLVNDPKFAWVLARELLQPRAQRIRSAPPR